MNRNEKLELLRRYQEGLATPEETRLVESWLDETGTPLTEWEEMPGAEKDVFVADLFEDIQKEIKKPQEAGVVFLNWRRVAAVAAIFILAISAVLFWRSKESAPQLAVLSAPSAHLR